MWMPVPETPSLLTDGQVNSTDGNVCSILGHQWEKLELKLLKIPFMTIGEPPMEHP